MNNIICKADRSAFFDGFAKGLAHEGYIKIKDTPKMINYTISFYLKLIRDPINFEEAIMEINQNFGLWRDKWSYLNVDMTAFSMQTKLFLKSNYWQYISLTIINAGENPESYTLRLCINNICDIFYQFSSILISLENNTIIFGKSTISSERVGIGYIKLWRVFKFALTLEELNNFTANKYFF